MKRTTYFVVHLDVKGVAKRINKWCVRVIEITEVRSTILECTQGSKAGGTGERA